MGRDDRVGGGSGTEPEVRDIGMGMAPETRRQQIVKLCWTLVYLLYMAYAVGDLVSGDHTVWATVLGWLGLVAFLVPYLYMVLSRRPRGEHLAAWQWAVLGWLYALAVTLSLTLGQAWLMFFVYVTIGSGVLLPFRLAARAVVAVSMSLLGVGLLLHANGWLLTGLVLPSLLGGGAMMGVSQMGRTMRELRAARETVAHLAANEERLRLARDLHDLLGHSLSLITLKSELAGRMLPDNPEEAARQVADIERVSRQALVDVREAVSGFRRPTLAVELAGVRTALHTAGVEARIAPTLQQPVAVAHPGLGAEQEGALAWALREAATNVVRHSGASACDLSLDEVWEADETRYLCLEVADDGRGPGRGHHAGNGLSGLEERLVLSGGRLETGASRRGGFTVRAYVPLRAVQDREGPEPSRPRP
ncbi:sensor histidine kinase [Streptomyces sp. ICBB 8177]|uniref:sensor histidine kinase n=1 Tax=Streptomyces sp. ICBB 8177 TaxID=563922 RepID=UPI000D67EB01|nr:sensor histidine kinase [Streptomyces sp. ICBB 8177]PWI43947.1 two-component sensor histidine kinase [Streptomyces sp. ICBB 8177]